MPPDADCRTRRSRGFGRWVGWGPRIPRSDEPQVCGSRNRPRRLRGIGRFNGLWPARLQTFPSRPGRSADRSLCGRSAGRTRSHFVARPPRRAQLRRLYYDLTGLPPGTDEVAAFERQPDAAAYEQVVERLLASPQFGERWGRHWLDVARYADTKGYVFQEDRNYPEAYTYRDWVIRAFNEDLPYDRFLVAQIAADQLPAIRRPHLAAMGFLTLGRRFINNKHDIIDDRIDVVRRGHDGPDRRLRPLPRPQVRPDSDGGLLFPVRRVRQFARAPRRPVAAAAGRCRPSRDAVVFLRGNPGNPGPRGAAAVLAVLAGPDRKPFQRRQRAAGTGPGDRQPRQPADGPGVGEPRVGPPVRPVAGPHAERFRHASDPPTPPGAARLPGARFVEEGWSVKRLIRRIVLSRTYRQAATTGADCRPVDPENLLLWRMNRRRLDFEALRDSVLAAGGRST